VACCDDPALRPPPAGGGLTRRAFLARSLGLALTVYGAGRLGLFDDGVAAAAAGPQERIVVDVFLEGGADALALLYPDGDPLYRKLRPKLALSGGTQFAEDDRLFWHPSLGPIAQLHAEGKVTVLPAIGYDHPDQSHFTSRHFWEVGATEPRLRTGWLGRYLDAVGTMDNPLQGLSLTGQLEPTLATGRVPVAAIDGPGQYDFWTQGVWDEIEERMLDTLSAFGSLGGDPAVRQVGAVAAQSERLRKQLAPFGDKAKLTPVAAYPKSDDEFPKRLAGLAAMIGAGLPLRCVSLQGAGEYDTHANQANDLATSLATTAQSLLAFQRDLESRGVADRVLTLVWSEFGRRAQENGSAGTDHGASGAAFLIGSHASGHMVGEFPGLKAGLDADGNLRATSDFRGLYAALLEQWLRFDASAVLPDAHRFGRPKLLKT
jgi:uncharacterized protein (DUF1501 family)